MPDELRLGLGFALAGLAAFAATPLAIAVAERTGFHDRPLGYKGHKAPTPYLGGAAVVLGFLLGGLTIGGELSRLSPIVVAAFGLWVLGTVDDRHNLSASLRLVLEFAVASVLWASGLGWDVFHWAPADLIVTNVWVVGLMNAFNLMDNMDGAAATVGAVTGATTAVLALIQGDVALAVVCLGLCGACVGFLPYNLASPARIFLGDGGSLPVGFVVAATIMALPEGSGLGVPALLAAVILAGLPVVDTALVMISRRRAGVTLLSGGRDHLTHRLVTRLGSARGVAITLGTVQAALGAVAIGVVQLGEGSIVSAWTIWFVVAAGGIALLETHSWAPARPEPDRGTPAGADDAERTTAQADVEEAALAADRPDAGEAARRTVPAGPSRGGRSLVEGVVIVFITLSCGLSPFFYGFYRASVWGPIALFLLAALLGLVIARPARPRPAGLVALGALVGMWIWSLASTGWAESAEQAMTEANRWMLYAALFAIVVLLLRRDRISRILLASATAAIVAFAAYLCVRFLGASGNELFLGKRLNEPLGYVNGQAGYMLLGLWPLVAAAERVRNHFASAAAVSAATVLVGLVLLSETRAVIPAVVLSALVLMAMVPGRRTRGWILVAIAAGVGAAAGPLIDVYDSGAAGGVPDAQSLQHAVTVLLAAAAAVGVVWGFARWAAGALQARGGGRELGLASAAGLVAVVIGAGVAGLVAVGDPVDRVSDGVHDFKTLEVESGAGRSRFTSGGGHRYDYWRVALDQFESHPVRGIGAGNYDRTYFAERRTTEDIKQPHSIGLQTLAELGLVGALALLVFVVAVLSGFMRRARAAARDLDQRAVVVAAGGLFLVWLVHTSVDWLHLIPGVTGFAMSAAAVLVSPWRRRRSRSRGSRSRRDRLRAAAIAGCAALVLLGAVLVGRSALAERYRSDARQELSSDPRAALAKADDSLDVDDEPVQTYYVRAAAYARLGDYERSRASLREAARREPHDFVTWALLGDLAVRRGDLAQAGRDYRRASRLNPRDRSLRQLARDPAAAG